MSNQVAYFVGNTKGRDHQPWPTITPAQLATLGFTRTIGMNLVSIMALAWRIKNWHISGSCNISMLSTLGGSIETASCNFVAPVLSVPMYADTNILATQEKDIIGKWADSDTLHFIGLRNAGFQLHTGGLFSPPPTQVFVTTNEVYDNNIPPDHEAGSFSSLFQFDVQIFGNGSDFEYVGFDSVASLFYPKIQCSAFVNAHFSRFFWSANSLAGTHGTVTINPVIVPSFVIPIKIDAAFILGAHGTVQATVLSANVNFTMTAVEFWPYRNSAGDPIYSSTTGAQLLDPFS